MRTITFFASLLFVCSLWAQSPASVSPQQTQADLRQAFTGDWVGVLEYRDYSEPATSTRRVQLPTWLSIAPSGSALREHFTYDDGPTKTVEGTDLVTFDPQALTYSDAEEGKPAQVYKVTGYDKLKSGRGDLVLIGTTTDNDKPAESRITLTIRRNLLSWTEEVRPAGSSEGFAFRHRFTFTRAQVPAVK